MSAEPVWIGPRGAALGGAGLISNGDFWTMIAEFTEVENPHANTRHHLHLAINRKPGSLAGLFVVGLERAPMASISLSSSSGVPLYKVTSMKGGDP
jgi:hypothetical protein